MGRRSDPVSRRSSRREVIGPPRIPNQQSWQKVLRGWSYGTKQNERQDFGLKRSSHAITAPISVQYLRSSIGCIWYAIVRWRLKSRSFPSCKKRTDSNCILWCVTLPVRLLTHGIHSRQRASTLHCNVLRRNCLRPQRNPCNFEMSDVEALLWPRDLLPS